jgi:hypothetical protein
MGQREYKINYLKFKYSLKLSIGSRLEKRHDIQRKTFTSFSYKNIFEKLHMHIFMKVTFKRILFI